MTVCPSEGYTVKSMPEITPRGFDESAFRFDSSEYFIYPVCNDNTIPENSWFGLVHYG